MLFGSTYMFGESTDVYIGIHSSLQSNTFWVCADKRIGVDI